MTVAPGAGMVLSELRIRNFRSCYETSVRLRSDLTVIVGENNSGKSNIIDALRLILTPHNRRRSRYFEISDLSFGRESEPIEIGATFDELTGIQRGQFATALALDDMTVRYLMRFALDPIRMTRSRPAVLVGPGEGLEAEPEKRDDLRHVYLAPLRDAQAELDSSNGRRLAGIIEFLFDRPVVEQFVADANSDLRAIETQDVVVHTRNEISAHLTKLTDPVRAQAMGIQFADHRLHRLAAALRLKMAEAGVDLADLTESGLGYANLLYIATVLLELNNAKDSELTVLLVEEPEAHLHPQLQAVLLQYLLEQASTSGGDDSSGPAGRVQVIVTTHSPVVAAGVPINNVIVLRSVRLTNDVSADPAPAAGGGEGIPDPATTTLAPTERTATAAIPIACLGLSDDSTRKLGQYLDATKAALLFGSRVVLVEGISEAILLPVIARRMFPAGVDDPTERLRRAISGLTIINIGSVDFEPYVRLLLTSYNGMSILDRLVVITDTDPPIPGESTDEEDPDDAKQDVGPVAGAATAEEHRAACSSSQETSKSKTRLERVLELANEFGGLIVKAAPHTLEADLLTPPANEPILRAAFIGQKPRSTIAWAEIVGADSPPAALYQKLRTRSRYLAKGQFSHDIAAAISSGAPFDPPVYLAEAIKSALEP